MRDVRSLGESVTKLEVLPGQVQAMEARLTEQILANREAVEFNQQAIAENGKAIARLEVRMTRVEDDVTWLRNNHRGDR